MDLPVFAGGEHPVDDTAAKVHVGIQCGPEAPHKAHRAQPPASQAVPTMTPRGARVRIASPERSMRDGKLVERREYLDAQLVADALGPLRQPAPAS